MMKALVIVITLVAILMARIGPRPRPHPVVVVLIAWLPALAFVFADAEFINPAYEVLNAGVSNGTFFAIALALLGFALGTAGGNEMVRQRLLRASAGTGPRRMGAGTARLGALFAVGLASFAYAFWNSGLLASLRTGSSAEAIFQNRLAFHVGAISHLVLLLDVTAVVFFAKFIETGRRAFLLPPFVAGLAYLATLQKSRVLFVVFSAVFVCLLHPRRAHALFFRGVRRKIQCAIGAVAFIGLLLLSNQVRGIGEYRYTNLSSPLLEEIFIYAGAPALRNLSGTMEGNIRTDAPSHGRIFARSLLWPFVDRETLSPTKYLEGINNGTALIFYWHDFHIPGIVIGATLAGFLASIAFHLARRQTAFTVFCGALAFNAVVMSIFTDMFFEPTSLILVALAAATSVFTRVRSSPTAFRPS